MRTSSLASSCKLLKVLTLLALPALPCSTGSCSPSCKQLPQPSRHIDVLVAYYELVLLLLRRFKTLRVASFTDLQFKTLRVAPPQLSFHIESVGCREAMCDFSIEMLVVWHCLQTAVNHSQTFPKKINKLCVSPWV